MSGSQKTNKTLGGERPTGVFPWHPSWGNWEQTTSRTGQAFPWHPLSGKPGDRLHARRDKPSPSAPLGNRLHAGRNKPSPGTPSQGKHGTDYMQDGTSLPRHFFVLHVVCLLVSLRGVPGEYFFVLHVVCPLVSLRGVPGELLSRPACSLSPGSPERGTTGDP